MDAPQEVVWRLKLASKGEGGRGKHIAKFQDSYVKNEAGIHTLRKLPPLRKNEAKAGCIRHPLYMWKEQEPENFSDDEIEKEKEKIGAYEVPKRKPLRGGRPVHWKIEDSRDPHGEGMAYVGDLALQMSKYVLFEVKEDSEEEGGAMIHVTPVDEWWKFASQTVVHTDEKLSVTEAMHKMLLQQQGQDVTGRSSKALHECMTSLEDAIAIEAGSAAALDLLPDGDGGTVGTRRAQTSDGIVDTVPQMETDLNGGVDTFVDQEAQQEGAALSADGEPFEGQDPGSDQDDAESIDFDEVFSDDEEQIDDTNNAEAGMESDDADSGAEREVIEGGTTERSLLNKALSNEGGGGNSDDEVDENDVYKEDFHKVDEGKKRLVEEEKKRDGGTVALASTSATLAAAAGAAATEPVSRKRPVYDKTDIAPRSKRMQAVRGSNPMESMIIEKMKSSGGRMKKKAFLNAFREWTRNDRDKERFRHLIKKLLKRADDAIEDTSALYSTGMSGNQLFATHVVFETTMGPFTMELYYKHAPHAAHNISDLARRGYYDGTSFHRIIKGFMVQGGDPTGTGRGGTSIYGERFRDEITPELKHTGAGVVSMANAGPNTNGSQFFVILAPCPWLDGKHTVLGRVSDGMGVIQRMGIVQTDANDRPMQEIKIIRSYPVSRIGDQETLLRDCKF